ncbi:MAG: VacJ family lipoprotein [Rhodospirillaceae bacterium]|nr:VacJ family lipoprotein [Rhodospirillaceae bacterium]
MRTTRMASIDVAGPIGDGGRHGYGTGLTCRALPGVRTAIAAAAVLVLSGCASTTPLSGDLNDSWESTNRTFYAFNDALDQAVLEPMARLYLRLPSDLRDSVHNFFDNAEYPGTVLNQLLQGKLEPTMEGSARFVLNTTLGIGGLFDVATGFGLEREEEDFGQTLAVWGVEEGNYIHWPVLGSSSVRDSPGLVVNALTDVLTYVAVFPAALLELIDARANLASAVRIRDEAAFDPYVFTREAYRQRRTFLIHDGNPPPRDPGADADDA